MLEIVAAILSIIVLLISMAVYGGRNKHSSGKRDERDPVEIQVRYELTHPYENTAFNTAHPHLKERYDALRVLQRLDDQKPSIPDRIMDEVKDLGHYVIDIRKYFEVSEHVKKHNGVHK